MLNFSWNSTAWSYVMFSLKSQQIKNCIKLLKTFDYSVSVDTNTSTLSRPQGVHWGLKASQINLAKLLDTYSRASQWKASYIPLGQAGSTHGPYITTCFHTLWWKNYASKHIFGRTKCHSQIVLDINGNNSQHISVLNIDSCGAPPFWGCTWAFF